MPGVDKNHDGMDRHDHPKDVVIKAPHRVNEYIEVLFAQCGTGVSGVFSRT